MSAVFILYRDGFLHKSLLKRQYITKFLRVHVDRGNIYYVTDTPLTLNSQLQITMANFDCTLLLFEVKKGRIFNIGKMQPIPVCFPSTHSIEKTYPVTNTVSTSTRVQAHQHQLLHTCGPGMCFVFLAFQLHLIDSKRDQTCTLPLSPLITLAAFNLLQFFCSGQMTASNCS